MSAATAARAEDEPRQVTSHALEWLPTFFRFVEITAIVVRDATGKAKHKVTIEHRTGARETLESRRKSRESTIECKRCIKCVWHGFC